MKVTVSFEMVDKKIEVEDVSGLVNFDFNPTNIEIGKRAIMMVESIASPKIVVGFAEPDAVSFFLECGWISGDIYDGKILVASDAVDEDKFDGNIW